MDAGKLHLVTLKRGDLRLGRQLLDVPVRPLNVTFRKPATSKKGKYLTALLYGDTHHGFQHEKTLAVIEAIARDLQPEVLVDMGDGVDCGHLSDKFAQDPMRTSSLQDEIDAKRIQLARFRETCPNSRYIYLEGNHEERLRRTMWNAEGPAKALIQLNIAQRYLTWPELLGLQSLHMEFYPYDDQTDKEFLPKFILKHGTKLSSAGSGYTATAELRRYNRSGASGHTHRLGVVWRRDHHGQHLWIETGCCADFKKTPGAKDPDWQHGCVVLTFDRKTGALQPEPIEIRDGHTLWRGQEYRA